MTQQHGVGRLGQGAAFGPVLFTLAIGGLHCAVHPVNKKPLCGTNATATIRRSEFGMVKYLPGIGDGPAGLLLSELLHCGGIASVVLEKSSREHVLSRIRAGALEQTTVDVLRTHGLAERMDREGQPHDGVKIVWAARR